MILDRATIGASRVAGCLGISPFSNPYLEFLHFRGELPAQDVNEAMLVGNDLEDGIRRIAERKLGKKIVKPESRVHPTISFLSASPDGVIDERTGVELKNVGPKAKDWGEPGTDQVPAHYLLQAQQQIEVFGFDRVLVGPLFWGNKWEQYWVDRDDELIRVKNDRLTEFWQRVQMNDPPPIDWNDQRTQDAIKQLFAVQAQETKELDEEAERICHQVRDYAATERASERHKEACKARLLHLMGTAGRAITPGGIILTRKSVHVAAHQRRASDSVRLLIKHPQETNDGDSDA